MSIKHPFTDLRIHKAPHGFYEGYSLPIALVSKIIMTVLVIWALVWPGNANSVLSAVNSDLLNSFNTFYIIAVGCFAFFLFILALLPNVGKKTLGQPGVKPEFSTFSWFSMMFGAGLGVGLMGFMPGQSM